MDDYRLGTRQRELLMEAFRRYECFAVRRDRLSWNLADLQEAWTGLGTRSEYRPAVTAGLMEMQHGSYDKGVDAWWQLTAKGAAIILAWHLAGFCCDNDGREMTTMPSLIGSY